MIKYVQKISLLTKEKGVFRIVLLFFLLCMGTEGNKGLRAEIIDDPSKTWCYLQKSTTVIGVPFHSEVTEVTYDGSLYTGYAELNFAYGVSKKPMMARQKNFKEGWIPIVEYTWNEDGIDFEYECFSMPPKGMDEDSCVNFIRLTMRNKGTSPQKGLISISSRGKLDDFRLAQLKDFSSEQTFQIEAGCFSRGGKLVYAFPKGFTSIEAVKGVPYKGTFVGKDLGVVAETETAIVSYEKELKGGESVEYVFKMPRVPVDMTNRKHIKVILQADYRDYERKCEELWKNLVIKNTHFEIPEKEVQDAQRASMVHLMLATRTKEGGWKTQTDGIPYPNFFLTSAPQMVMAYLTSNCWDYAKLSVKNAIKQQEPDGLYFDRSLAHGGIIPTAHGHILYMVANYVLFTHDYQTGKEVFPSVVRAIDYLKRVTKENKYGLMPPTYPYDNEMIDGHYASNNYWSLIGLRFCIRMAKMLGHTEVVDDWSRFEKVYTGNILKGIEASVHFDGYVPTGLYPFLTGKKARRGFNEYQTNSDWENMLLSYPTELLEPHHPYVSGTLNHVRRGYAEGIMTYRHGQHLHQYITANLIEQYMVQGNSRQALIDFYHLLLHSGSTYEGFENLVEPWKERMVDAHCPPPHAWAAGKTAFLIRNFLIHEFGGRGGINKGRKLFLYSAISPAWVKDGEKIAIINAPTEMGDVTSSMVFHEGSATVTFSADFKDKPEAIVVRIPYFKEFVSFTSDASTSSVHDGMIELSPDVTRLDIQWKEKDDAHDGTSAYLLKSYRAGNTFKGVAPNGYPIIEEGRPFLLEEEQIDRVDPLSFDLVKQMFLYEFNRRKRNNE